MSDGKDDGWLVRLRNGLSQSSQKLAGGITDLFTNRKLDARTLEDLEEILISSDLGVKTATRLASSLADRRFEQDVASEVVRAALAEDVAKILRPVAMPLKIDSRHAPHVILVCGVNGSGKTTTIGKMAKQFTDEGNSVVIAAGDTFRAAAVEQLEVWGERSGSPVIKSPPGGDAAALAYTALEQAKAAESDVLMIDTAGRLQNRKDLMAELEKVVRVIGKVDETAPHSVLLVMDATIGQNAHSQVQTFMEMVDVTGLVLTKLDGSAKGGVVVALAESYGLPVHAIGVGEAIDDLRPFEAGGFARSLMGLH